MAKVKPFQGIRYNTDKVDNIGDTICLPYDKISKDQLAIYKSRSAHNMAQVILGEELEGDHDSSNKYSRAADYVQKWLDEGVLIEDTEASFYIYEQEYTIPGTDQVKRRTALMGMTELQEFDKKIILPHERTLDGPKADRLKLMQHTGMNFGQIFGLYKDDQKKVSSILDAYKSKTPYMDVNTPEEDVRHRLWVVTDATDTASIEAAFDDKQIYIADGHHRYSTALIYRDELREQLGENNADAWYNYRLMSLVDVADEGMIVLPTHRIVRNLKDFDASAFVDQLGQYFEMETFVKRERVMFLDALQSQTSHALGLSVHDDEEYYLLSLKDNEAVTAVLKDQADCLKTLDVTILHQIILHHILGMVEEDFEKQSYVTYARSSENALNQVDDGDAQISFIMQPTAVQEVLNVSDASEYMPQKSTDFFPKLFTGTVFARLLNLTK